LLEGELARDLTYGRQQLLWQKRVIIICSINLDTEINKMSNQYSLMLTVDTPTFIISD